MGIGMGNVLRRASLAAAVACAALAATSAQGTTDRLGLSSFANHGRGPAAVAPAMRAALQRAGAVAPGRMLALRDGRAFIEFDRATGGNCYGIRRREVARFSFTCWSDFPSTAHPLLDQSVFGANVGEPIHVIEAQGFAADGVAAVAVEDATGTTVARTSVVGNVYSIEGLPATGIRLVALDGSGRVLFAVPR
jgi:hypothetical protein